MALGKRKSSLKTSKRNSLALDCKIQLPLKPIEQSESPPEEVEMM